MRILDRNELTEAEIRDKYIDPSIESAGWDMDTQVEREYFFTDGRVLVSGSSVSRGKRKFADYLLSYKPNIPLAIIEAKDAKHSPGAGMQQGLEYAAILDIRFVYSTNGEAFIEHDRLTGKERELRMDELPSPDELWRRYKGGAELTSEQERIVTEPYHFDVGDYPPRYYQRIAINRTVEAVAKGQKRLLIVMATGTGKTYTSFQIIHRLWKSRTMKKVLFLVDRNFLADQTMQKDFKPFAKIMTKVRGRRLDSSYEIFMALYQQLAGDDNEEPFRAFTPDFFDLIIVDECHRGSAKETSQWRRILNYFSSATQIGMTATPKETKDASNISYFGDPLYIYSLKQGLEDGFLAPYRVYRPMIDTDTAGWRPSEGQRDLFGEEIDDREYNVKDFDRNIIIEARTEAVAKYISDYMKQHDRSEKTIVFCVNVDHAERMRQALVNENSDLVAENDNYIMRITGDEHIGKSKLEDFMDPNVPYPVIVTTSQLMTTGADCKTCKLIVLDKNVESMTEFKQIIGRGTRLDESHGKMFFTVIDFRGATKLFADPDFDGDPVDIYEGPSDPPSRPEPRHEDRYIPRVEGSATVIGERVQYLDADGNLTHESITMYSKENITSEYATLKDFLAAWNSVGRKQAIIDELEELGLPLDHLRDIVGNKDMDDFDLICHIAYDAPPLTRAERAASVKKRGYLYKYSGLAQSVLSALLDKYQESGIKDLDNIQIFLNDPLRRLGSPQKIVDEFGGRSAYEQAVADLLSELYAAA